MVKINNKHKGVILLFTFPILFVIAIFLIIQPLSIPQLMWLNSILILSIIIIQFCFKEKNKVIIMAVLLLSIIATIRYIYWRTFNTLHFPDKLSAIFGITLYCAEMYSWCVLFVAFFQSLFPLNREVLPLTSKEEDRPTVDLFVPTYNESLSIVKVTLYAAKNLLWPKHKLNIWLLDDGKRPEFKAFCDEIGVNYLARPTNEHAKAGNLNYALKQTDGEFVAIFDCDHIMTKNFLLQTMGWFLKDPKLALVQTPHYFFSPDPIERNLNIHKRIPGENNLFYGVIQDGNDTWNAAFFCGSCAILRREPLMQIGGIAIETVTEDAHTALKMHRLGYNSAYLKTPLSAGLATETLSGHIGQRIRWARGMTQILRMDNPVTGKGLSIPQRICYFGVMIHYLSCIFRIIFLFSPLAFLLFHSYIISASAILIFLYVFPHLLLSIYVNHLIQGKYRHSFFSEIYETILCFYIFVPVVVALFAPHKGTFNVTAKGGLVEEKYVDFKLLIPLITSCSLLFLGVAFGIYRLTYDIDDEFYTILFSLVWCFYNLIVLGSCIYVSIETKQLRKSHRVGLKVPIHLKTNYRKITHSYLSDFSADGLGVRINKDEEFSQDEKVEWVCILDNNDHVEIPVQQLYMRNGHIGLLIKDLTHEQYMAYIALTFGRPGIWNDEVNSFPPDKLYKSFYRFFKYGIAGYYKFYQFIKFKLSQKVKSFIGTN